MNFVMQLVDQSQWNLSRSNNPRLQRHLDDPRSQVREMIRQVNAAKYYGDIFQGRDLTFVDLGANLGMVSLFAAPHCRRVLAVEAEPETFRYLQLLAEPFKQIECLNVALAPCSGPVEIGVDPNDFSCHTVTNRRAGGKTATVAGLTLPDIFRRVELTGADVCKVDVEGAEMESLSQEVINSAPVKCWYIEVHRTPQMTRERSLVTMTGRLRAAGFACTTPRPNAIIAKR